MYPEHDTFDGSNQERLRRLKYVTENFHTLQGLTLVVAGVELLAVRVSHLFLQSWLRDLLLLPMLFVCVIAIKRLPRYYERRFGQVEQQQRPITPGQAIGCLGLIVGILVFSVFGRPLGRFLDPICAGLSYRLHPMLADPNHRVNFLPILFWLLSFALSISSCHFRRIDLRRTSFWLGGTLVWVAIMTLPLHHPDLLNLIWWKVLNAGWFGISLIMIGLYDHFTLVLLLPRASEVEQ